MNCGNKAANNEAHVRAYTLGGGDGNPDSNVVTGTFILNNRYAYILFDSGADRSFVLTMFSALFNIPRTALDVNYTVELADGRIARSNTIIRGCTLNLLYHLFNIDLMPVELGSFDVIIGMDWLSKYHVVIVCDEKIVRIPYGNEILIVRGDKSYGGSSSRLNIISCAKTQKYIQKGCHVLWAHISAKNSDDKSKEEQLEDSLGGRHSKDGVYDSLWPLLVPSNAFWIDQHTDGIHGSDESGVQTVSGFNFMIVFIDDILIYSKNKEDHEEHLKLILEFLKKEELYAKFPKCEFWLQKMLFLGHMINSEGIYVDLPKINSIKDWALPKTPTKIHRFLGLSSYYRRFIKGFSKIAKPMMKLTQKNVNFDWGEKEEATFQLLKKKLCSASILALPEGSDNFVVYYDASHKGLGTVLGKANMVADALSRKERIKPLRVRALVMTIGFEETQSMERNRIKRNIEGNEPSEARAEENRRREMNLPLLLVAHLGRSEDGQPPWSSLTSVHRGRQSSINTGEISPNGTFLSNHAQPFIPNSVAAPNGFVHAYITPYSQPLAGIINGQTYSFLFSGQTGNTSVGGASAYPPPTHGLKQEKSPLVELRMIEGTTSKGQGNLPEATLGDKEVETGSHLTRIQIEEAVRSGQLSHLVKGIKKERTKTSDNQRGEKREKSTTPAEAPILMIDREEARTRNNVHKGPTSKGREITFPLATKGNNSSAPVIIKAKILEGKGRRGQDNILRMRRSRMLSKDARRSKNAGTTYQILVDKCMRTRNSYFPNNSSVTIPRRQNKRRTPNIVKPELRTIIEVAPMADNRTMEEILQAPTEGYGEAIVISEINADHFEIKTNLLQLVQANPYHGFERENPHTHINNFKRITSTLKFRDVPNDVIKLMMFPYSLQGSARVWYDKEPPNSILTWEDLVNKFVNQFFPPSKTTHLKNEISQFTQRFEETFGEAWERFKEMLRACPHQRFTKENASKTDDRIDKLADQISTLVNIFAKKVVTPALVKAVEESCVTYGGPHAHYNCDATNSNQPSVCVVTGTYNQVAPQNRASNYMEPPGFAPNQSSTSGTLSSNAIPNPKGEMKAITIRSGVAYEGLSIPTPKKVVEQETEETTDKEQINFQGSTAHIQPLVTLIPKHDVSKTLPKPNIPYPSRLNDQKLREKATNQMERFFQIFQDLHFDISFADALLLMPKFTSTIKSLLANKDKNGYRSITRPKGVAEDVLVKVGKFYFLTDFVVVDFEADPRIPLILGRSFVRTGRALIDVYGEEITLRVNDEAVTFNLDQTMRYSSTYDDLSVNRIDIIDVSREEYAQEILGFSKNSLGGNPTSTYEPIISNSSPSLSPFEGSDFILEEIEAYLKDESISPKIDHQGEVAKAKSSIEEPSELELKDLPSHLEYAYLEGKDKLPVIITKYLKFDENEALLKVLKSHKKAIACKITDIKGIDPRFCTHKILMEEDYKPVVQSQRRVNPKIHKVIKKEVIKLLDAGMIYSISDSLWVSPIHCVPKKGGITVVENENNELIPKRLVTGWRVCIDYMKLNDATRKDHFPLPFMDHMLERLAGNEFYYFLDGFSGYIQILINPPDQEKTTFTCPYGTFAYRRMPFGLCNAPRTFQRISRPMTHLLEKETPFVFSKDSIDAFETLKNKLTETPILVVPDWNLPFELMCDASDFEIGAVLGKRKTKHFQPIHYASKTMTEAQIHYTTMEKEMLAVVYAFEKFRPYLVLSKSIMYTDHSALKYLFSKQDAKPRLIQWVLLLQEFDIIIRDKKGTENLVADHLS
nr:reverse transcriptase domain-containing protein [Tanacetum cinerariifolium]